jgi:hypothetical protein
VLTCRDPQALAWLGWTSADMMFYFCSMQLQHPIDSYTPLSQAEMEHALVIGTKLNSRWLPVSRRGVDRVQRDKAEEAFAKALAQHLMQSNFVLFRGPPSQAHSTPVSSQS